MTKKWRSAAACITCLLYVLLTVLPVYAATTPNQGINLQISPLPISLTAKPGSSVSTDLRVRNAGSEPETYQIRLLKVTEDDEGEVHLSDPTEKDEWADWVTFSKNTFNAPPGEWQTIKMTINLPKTAAFGYYFAVEYSRATPVSTEAGKATARGAAATFILLNADAPGAKREAKVISFTATKKSYEFLPATFSAKVRATGNVHVAPHGNVFLLKGKKQIGIIPINAAEGNILPDSSRYFEASWDDGFPVYKPKLKGDQPVVDSTGKPVSELSWDFSKINKLRFGKYTAKLLMVYDDGQRDVPIEASLTFWVIPWRIIAGVALFVVALIALIVYVFVLRGRLKRMKSRFRFTQKKK